MMVPLLCVVVCASDMFSCASAVCAYVDVVGDGFLTDSDSGGLVDIELESAHRTV